jgi:transcriptional regulator with XRE-family HTH domain
LGNTVPAPLGHGLRPDFAKLGDANRSAQLIDDVVVVVHLLDCNHSYFAISNHSFMLKCNPCYMSEPLADRIVRLRKAKQLTQQQVADYCDVSRVAVTKWEMGQTKNLKHANIVRLAELFEITVEDLISDTPSARSAHMESNAEPAPRRARPALTPDERKLLQYYRQSQVQYQKTILDVARAGSGVDQAQVQTQTGSDVDPGHD